MGMTTSPAATTFLAAEGKMEPVSIEAGGTRGTEAERMEVGGKIPAGVGKQHHQEEEDGDTAAGKAGTAEDGKLPLKVRRTPGSEGYDVHHPATKPGAVAGTIPHWQSATTNADDGPSLKPSEICPHASDDARAN